MASSSFWLIVAIFLIIACLMLWCYNLCHTIVEEYRTSVLSCLHRHFCFTQDDSAVAVLHAPASAVAPARRDNVQHFQVPETRGWRSELLRAEDSGGTVWNLRQVGQATLNIPRLSAGPVNGTHAAQRHNNSRGRDPSQRGDPSRGGDSSRGRDPLERGDPSHGGDSSRVRATSQGSDPSRGRNHSKDHDLPPSYEEIIQEDRRSSALAAAGRPPSYVTAVAAAVVMPNSVSAARNMKYDA